jgi:glutathione S-transferase
MRTLYHFTHSPFSRRTRLALAHKGLECELREARDNPAWLEEAQRLVPFRTIPVLVDDGRAMADSGAISHWLDGAYPHSPRLWPEDEESLTALQLTALVDVALDTIVDLGTRYHALRDSPSWGDVKQEMLGRAHRALAALAELAAPRQGLSIVPSGWSVADMWLYTMVAWLDGLPARAPTNPRVAQVLSLGAAAPATLSAWAQAHRARDDIQSLG